MATMIGAIDQPIYLLDVRRNGVGGQGSWAPREFATIVPEQLPREAAYDYLHLPCLAPSIPLLSMKDLPWREFRDRYVAELTPSALSVARAFVEAAVSRSGLAVFLCAEPHQPAFDELTPENQQHSYCHRYTLAHKVADTLRLAWPVAAVDLVYLDLVDFAAQAATGTYVPHTAAA
jgi:hypothetical protein